MTFNALRSLYASFMEGSALRHQDLVKPICDYAASINTSAVTVLKNLQSSYSK